MKKLNELRSFLIASVRELQADPLKLDLWADKGRIINTNDPSVLSFNLQYTANILVQEFTGKAQTLILPILTFIKKNEMNHDAEITFGFDANIIDTKHCDVLFTLKFTEKNIVIDSGDGHLETSTCEDRANWWVDPPNTEFILKDADGNEVAKWKS